MNRFLCRTLMVLVCCAVATLPAFTVACVMGALFANNAAPFPASLFQAVAFFMYGSIPCCSVGMVLALMCWALIPPVDRLCKRVLRAMQPGRIPSAGEPHTPGASPRVATGSGSVTAGVVTGIALSLLNVPAYIVAPTLGVPAMALAFLSAGIVAGSILGWLRGQGGVSRLSELFTTLMLLP